ncbi:uncharacterized protein LOC116019654 [Ipomoea triloba]|uniref:uncharacterized protein LOC116019654 n=1 Tax=Ipomoea triloba TaxID=35885 RepID=UPI00125D6BB2|nr:uncharacterized protein LOC116019654 [Ipomoea triloba]
MNEILKLLRSKSGVQSRKAGYQKLKFDNWIRVEALGFSGGIWLFWNNPLTVNIIFTDPQFILSQVKDNGSEPWFFSIIYGSPTPSLRKKLWRNLDRTLLNINGPWLSVGDYNAVADHEEVSNPRNFSHYRCTGFIDWMFDQGLLDLGYTGSKFTWQRGNSQDTFKAARLDRALCNLDFQFMWKNLKVDHLPRVGSDHSPILVSFSNVLEPQRNHHFRFLLPCLTHQNLNKIVANQWVTNNLFQTNLTNLAEVLGTWNREEFGVIEKKKKRLLARIDGIQRRLEVNYESGLIRLLKKLQGELEEVLKQEELKWFQKSKEEWIVSGDRNTKYYHAVTFANRRRNKIGAMFNNQGILTTDTKEMRELVVDHFTKCFTKDEDIDLSLAPANYFPTIQEEDWRVFNRPFTEDDIKKAVYDMAPNKAAGPDGFIAAFYQQHWSILGKTIFNMASAFFNTGVLEDNLNDTYIVLIPKVKNPEFVTQFRPISLCNISYKIITKAMSNRLRVIMPNLIGPFQSSFVHGRQISDNVIIYQEVLNYMRKCKGKKGYILVKIDLEKAYDRLSWDFIQDTLQEVKFNPDWIRNIMTCISTARFSILWDGQRSDFFNPSRGIRQGDPISPFIFVLCIERLCHLIQGAVSNGSWKGIQISKNGPSLSHLCFADDMILFGEAMVSQAEIMIDCLNKFCSSSGQKVSFLKSQLFVSPNTANSLADDISRIMSILITKELGKYLGVPSLHGRVNKSTFAAVEERITTKLQGWKTKYLSLAGRHVLAQSVLSSIPYYLMQTSLLPKGLCDNIDRKIRQFIWGGPDLKRSCNLVKWEVVTKPKAVGGLGIKSMRHMNLAFLAKLGWRLLKEDKPYWIQVLKAKYTGRQNDINLIRPVSRSSNAWRGINAAMNILKKGSSTAIGYGNQTKFWTSKWLIDDALGNVATSDIPLEDIDLAVRDYWSSDTGWNTQRLAHLLPQGIINTLNGVMLSNEPNHKDLRTRLPNRIKFFMWLITHGRIMCNAERKRRHFTASDYCHLCRDVTEDIDHVLRKCPAAMEVWKALMPPQAFEGEIQIDCKLWIMKNLKVRGRRYGFLDWSAAFSVICWQLWKWRNSMVFKNETLHKNIKANKIRNYCMEIHKALDRNPIFTSQPGEQRSSILHWNKLESGWIAVNVDGSSRPSKKKAGCGGILRNHLGDWILGFQLNLGDCSMDIAEARAVLMGLKIAWQRACTNIIIQRDSKNVVKWINDPLFDATRGGTLNNIIFECKSWMKRSWNVKCCHVLREQNQVADWLARNQGADTNLVLLNKCPNAILDEFVRRDRIGSPVARGD